MMLALVMLWGASSAVYAEELERFVEGWAQTREDLAELSEEAALAFDEVTKDFFENESEKVEFIELAELKDYLLEETQQSEVSALTAEKPEIESPEALEVLTEEPAVTETTEVSVVEVAVEPVVAETPKAGISPIPSK